MGFVLCTVEITCGIFQEGGGGGGRGHLAFPGVCCHDDDRSHQGEYQVQAWEGSESDQPLIFL